MNEGLDAIAAQYTEGIDRVYPPMKWIVEMHDNGAVIVSEQEHVHHLTPPSERFVGAVGTVVMAWNRREAEARVIASLGD